MWGETPPMNSGRERAIEILIDSDPNGAHYRASRILDEVVPFALSSRPNLVTRSALVEEAHSLSKYEIDTVEKYLPDREGPGAEDVKESTLNEDFRERVIRHYVKMATAKRGSSINVGVATPPPQFVAALRKIYGKEDSLPLLLRSVMNHIVFTGGDHPDVKETSTEEKFSEGGVDANAAEANLEVIIGNLCSGLDAGDEAIQGALIAILSILSVSIVDAEEQDDDDDATTESTGKAKARNPLQDTTTFFSADSIENGTPLLQVGAVLSLLKVSNRQQEGPFQLDRALLDYFGKAASTYEERIVIQKARLLDKMQAEAAKAKDAKDTNKDSVDVDSNEQIPIVPLTPTEENDGVAIVENEEEEEDDDQIHFLDSGTSITGDAFNHIISNITGDHDDDDDDDDDDEASVDREDLEPFVQADDDSSGSDSSENRSANMTETNPSNANDTPTPDNGDDSSSDVSTTRNRERDDFLVDDADSDDDEADDDDDDADDDDDDDEEEDDSMLREVLARSLEEQHTGTLDDRDVVDDSDSINNEESRQRASTSIMAFMNVLDTSATDETDDIPLPKMPEPPSSFPYAPEVCDVDNKDAVDSTYLDPASLTKFGSVPAPNTVVHLFRHLMTRLLGQMPKKQKQDTVSKMTSSFTVLSGGMGSSLFASHLDSFAQEDQSKKKGASDQANPVSLQLFVAAVMLLVDQRATAIDELKKAVSAEQMAANGEGYPGGNLNEGTPLSDEEDDPALALAMNYVEDTSIAVHPSVSESLETKGMTRKAAAAAHEAALHLKSLRKKKVAWKERVKLLSFCTLQALTCLRSYLQSTVSTWLSCKETGQGTQRPFNEPLPQAVMSKFSAVLTSLKLPSRSFLELVEEDEEEQIEELFRPLALFRAALSTWAECIPLLHASVASQEALLHNLLNISMKRDMTDPAEIPSLDDLTAVPDSESDLGLYQLTLLLRRLSVSDALGCFVPSPICFNPESPTNADDEGSEVIKREEYQTASSIIRSVSPTFASIHKFAQADLERFLFALCHRHNTRGILWDGLYACSHIEPEQSGTTMLSHVSSSTESIRVSQNPSTSLQFDSTKCSDSIAILSNHSDGSSSLNGSSAHQRASKVWGTVLSSTSYSPKTGVHRWAVRLDRCERGHVFVGVSTAQASMRTYVGGDKYGWGVIGTQALWHERRKIRGDYGATFRTGSVIIVTLDTDAGTLSFSTWKDTNSPNSSYPLDPHMPTVSSPRRGGASAGSIDDWGVAFEGLPLDARLYPAVGLYQRDDRVTLLPVDSGKLSGGDDRMDMEAFAGGLGYFPRTFALESGVSSAQSRKIRKHNEALSLTTTAYVVDALKKSLHDIEEGNMDTFALTALPALASSLSLLPTGVPVLSQRFALSVLPHVTRCINALTIAAGKSEQRCISSKMAQGKWLIRATGSSTSSAGNEYEEYVVDFEDSGRGNLEFTGKGVGTTGKSKNGLVGIVGTTLGSGIHFIEDWTDGVEPASTSDDPTSSSCVVVARMNLHGTKFEGTYQNVQYGTTGHIAGVLCDKQKHIVTQSDQKVSYLALLSLAHVHLATMIALDSAGDISSTMHKPSETPATKWVERCAKVQSLVNRQTHFSFYGSNDGLNAQHQRILDEFSLGADDGGSFDEFITSVSKEAFVENTDGLIAFVKGKDSAIAPSAGGLGSLRGMCPSEYDSARFSVVATLVRLSKLDVFDNDNDPILYRIWRSALLIMENGLRRSISNASASGKNAKSSAKERCMHIAKVSELLLSLDADFNTGVLASDVALAVTAFFEQFESADDLLVLRVEQDAATGRGLLRAFAFSQIASVLEMGTLNGIVVECLVAGLPRLMGRGTSKETRIGEGGGGLNEHYLDDLGGACNCIVMNLRRTVASIYSILGRRLKGAAEFANDTDELSFHSEALAILAASCVSTHRCDIDGIILDSGIYSALPGLLNKHRASLIYADAKSDIESVSAEIKYAVLRDVSRAIVRSCLAVANVVTFQISTLAQNVSTDCCDVVMARSVNLVLDEFQQFVPLTEDALKSRCASHDRAVAENDYATWLGIFEPNHRVPKRKTSKASQIQGYTGLQHLLEQGTLLSTVNVGANPSRGSSRREVDNPATRRIDMAAALGMPAHHHLSHCLHLLCTIVKSKLGLRHLLEDQRWTNVVFSAIGLDVPVARGVTATSLPSRFRGRLLILLRRICREAKPNKSLVVGLFRMASDVVSSSGEDEVVARECVSLLRALHSSTSPSWRSIVEVVIAERLPASLDEVNSVLPGILLFLCGSQGMLRKGSYVLLKPSAASILSSENMPSPGSKSHSSVASANATSNPGIMPHHIIGNGTEGIVAGLCRMDSSAGIITGIDVKTGTCEVVLVEREVMNSLRDGEVPKPQRGGLTVRALRTPLKEVAHAQELPLCFDESFPVDKLFQCLLPDALSRLRNSLNTSDSAKETKRHDLPRHLSVLLLRAAIVVLSDQNVLRKFQTMEMSRSLLCELLQVASSEAGGFDNDSKNLSLAALALTEGRYDQLTQMREHLRFRIALLKSTPTDTWVSRGEALKASRVGEGGDAHQDMDADVAVPNEPSNTGDNAASAFGSRSEVTDSNPREPRRGASNSSGSGGSSSSSNNNNNTEDEDESEAAATAAAHLREAAIAQMAELGLPRSWSELALRRTGGTNIEAAVHFCLERGGDMERLLAEERERERSMQRQSSGGASRRRGNRDSGASNHLLRQLLEMGFPSRWCAEALAATRNNVDEALTWILTNGERLSAEDEGMEEDEDEDDDDGEDENEEDDSVDDNEEDDGDGSDENETRAEEVREARLEQGPMNQEEDGVAPSESTTIEDEKLASPKEADGWIGSVTPLRFISGRSIINPKTLSISGLPAGGFSSVGTKGIMLTSGKWYYEAILETAGCLQIGWADGSFSGHCHADKGDGCGDGPSSWAYDGWRRYRWHSSATEWGCRWKEGDVVGCLVDMDKGVVSFTLNGKGEEIGMGVAYSGQGFRPCGGVYACVSFNRREKLRLVLGGDGNVPFRYAPPPGYKGVGEAVLASTAEYKVLLQNEALLTSRESIKPEAEGKEDRRFLCDFSDGEHGHELFAWQHRYYGSDASVHLGSGRNGKPSGGHKSSSSSGNDVFAVSSLASKLVERAWSEKVDDDDDVVDAQNLEEYMRAGFQEAVKEIETGIADEGLTLSVLYSRKLLLNLAIVSGDSFELSFFRHPSNRVLDEESVAYSFWRILDDCVSLRSAGWVGEAGAMAVAAEALGLGISSNEQQRSSGYEKLGSSLVGDASQLPIPGLSQLLNSVHNVNTSTSVTLAACAEASLGTEGGTGPLVFLQRGLQNAVSKSSELRRILVAVIFRAVRLLAGVDYSGEDGIQSENEEDEVDGSAGKSNEEPPNDGQDSSNEAKFHQPDARLTCFLTGLLLSKAGELSANERLTLMRSLLGAWSIGLLSASAPWRMVCALTNAAILRMCPEALVGVVQSSPTVSMYYSRLLSTVVRRMWTERAALPVCSRYVQAQLDLLSSVQYAQRVHTKSVVLNKQITVDAATPLPINGKVGVQVEDNRTEHLRCWEEDEAWLLSDCGWGVWTGTMEFMVTNWKQPSRSAVRTLMDGGEGPPMLREGCTVIRGLDWEMIHGDEDGKSMYESEKAAREKEKRALEEQSSSDPADTARTEQQDPAAEGAAEAHDPDGASGTREPNPKGSSKKKRRKKIPNPKLPIGTVIGVEPWNGLHAMARRVRWNLTGKEGVYRYGGDGGRFDISHVEVNDKSTRVRKRHPLPESAEQCAARHGFGSGRKYAVILRLNRKKTGTDGFIRSGVLELPDFGAGIRVDCEFFPDGAVTLTEKELLYGSKDSGWEARFGAPSYEPGTSVILTPTRPRSRRDRADLEAKSSFSSLYQELLGSSSSEAKVLRNRADGSKIRITSELRLMRGLEPSRALPSFDRIEVAPRPPPPLTFDREYHASSVALSRDGRTVTCTSPDGRGTAFASIGFTKGVHYWEVKLEQADIGSVFIGVAEKPNGSSTAGNSFGHDSPPRLNRWIGCGFVNFRATYTSGAERVYGAHCHNEDTVGVLLDCDAGRISFFYDGLKYGEHILNDLGCAFENISPFGFNADGCGSGGAGQGAPSGTEGSRGGRYHARGVVRPKALWPVIGLRNPGDRVTFSTKWMTSHGVDAVSNLRNVLAVDEILSSYCSVETSKPEFPDWFLGEAYTEYQRWKSRRWYRTVTRGSGPYTLATTGLDVVLDTSPCACAAACATLGLRKALLPGDRLAIKRSAGRILELAEEAVVLGSYQGRLFYRIVSQKSEGGSLTEGGGRAWFWDESEVVDDELDLIGTGRGLGISLPVIDRFRCLSTGGLKIVYEGGAVMRSDLEIFDHSENLGTIAVNTILPAKDVLERRVNSCGVVRYRVRYATVGEGWISSRIRGGKEEAIVEPIHTDDEGSEIVSCETPEESADIWFKEYSKRVQESSNVHHSEFFDISSQEEFNQLVRDGALGSSPRDGDARLAVLVCAIADHTEDGDAVECDFNETLSALEFAVSIANGKSLSRAGTSVTNIGAVEAAGKVLSKYSGEIPSCKALLARIAVLRSFNRRARVALPWLSLRPSQEGTAIMGGLYGHGASVERAGRGRLVDSKELWMQAESMASRVRQCRRLFFSSIKLGFLYSVTGATTTPTPLSHDEYELPREIRTVRVNRLKARRAMAGEDQRAKRKYSVFAQLHNETRGWGGAALRRGFVAKGHGGQKRAFKVKLVGEGVNDYSGPYREVFTDAMAEIVQSSNFASGDLAVLDPTPNNATDVGDNRDLFMFAMGESTLVPSTATVVCTEEQRIKNSFSSLTMPRNESSREIEESLVFLGRVVGTACRHGIPVDLPLPLETVWNQIAEEHFDIERAMIEIDYLQCKQLQVTNQSRVPPIVLWQQRMLNSFVDGLANVLPIEILTLLTGEELRNSLCGNGEIDVDLLKRVVEYEGYVETDPVIRFFWESLREMSREERKKFLQFVWARSRLPNRESDFDAPFKIQKDHGQSKADRALPSASTCFFTLTLPEYSSKEILRRKLLFAINNVCTMESDYVTNDAEVGEGWRGLE